MTDEQYLSQLSKVEIYCEILLGILRYTNVKTYPTEEEHNKRFEQLKMEKITADVDTKNKNSVKILEKFMSCSKEFFNESDNCIDRRYQILKNDWL